MNSQVSLIDSLCTSIDYDSKSVSDSNNTQERDGIHSYSPHSPHSSHSNSNTDSPTQITVIDSSATVYSSDELTTEVRSQLESVLTSSLTSVYRQPNGQDCQLPYIILPTCGNKAIIALVDTGASLSLLSERSAQKLSLQPYASKSMTITGVHGTETRKSNVYKLTLYRNGQPIYPYVSSITDLQTTFRAPSFTHADCIFLRNRGVDVDEIMSSREFNGTCIDMLLGNDFINMMTKNSKSYYLPSGRLFQETEYGTITYPTPSASMFNDPSQVTTVQVVDYCREEYVMTAQASVKELHEETENPVPDPLADQVAQLWNLENIGISALEDLETEQEKYKQLVDKFKKEVEWVNGRVHVPLPFNGRESTLNSNYGLAACRLKSLVNKLNQKKTALHDYNEIIKQQLESGIIELVPPEEVDVGPQYYIPHQVVIKEDSLTTKLRIVLDASSKMKNEASLNDCLFPGPSILQDILGILLRSRTSKYMMLSDIEKAFHQVHLQAKYRNVTKFLWLRDPSKPASPQNTITYRFTRIPFGVTCSPFLLAITILMFLDLNPRDINERILENLYVDNVMFTTNDESELHTLYTDSKQTFTDMGMNLREYVTNSDSQQQLIPEKDRAPDRTCKFLGHRWNSVEDTYDIKLADPPKGWPTKRQVTSFLASTYDPQGLVSPLTVTTKSLIQEMWNTNMNWSDRLPAHLLSKWETICLNCTQPVYTVPRQVTNWYDYTAVQLILFSDASKDHYATTAYLHYQYPNRAPVTTLFLSKSKVKPANSTNLTIPKLELMGMEIATNAASLILKETKLPVTKVRFFTDSMIALYWVLKKEQYRAFVSNRVAHIHSTTSSIEDKGLLTSFHHVPTDQNPADIATRGATVSELQNNDMWHHGPEFLNKPEEQWPSRLSGSIACPREFREAILKETVLPKTKKCPKALTKESFAQVNAVTLAGPYKSFVPYERTNSLAKLTNVMSAVMRWLTIAFPKHKWKGQSMQDFAAETDELKRRDVALTFIVKDHYRDSKVQGFPLPTGIPMRKDSDGVIRHPRQIQRAELLTKREKDPVVIVRQHKLAELVATQVHLINDHAPEASLVLALRMRFWIHQDGILCRQVVSKCVACRRMIGRPYQYDFSTDLPEFRLGPTTAFQYVGLDYMGPLSYSTEPGKTAKSWVLLYTCLVTRAVHLELMTDNTTGTYLMGLQRIFARRGVPKTILSDNARTFVLGATMINSDIYKFNVPSESLTSFLATRQIDYRYIVPLSPWQGGIYERIVGVVKSQLYKILRRYEPNFFELETSIIRVEGILNNRPITPNSAKIGDQLALRPIDYLLPGVQITLPQDLDSVFQGTCKTTDTESLTRQYMAGFNATEELLAKKFMEHYVIGLRESKYRSRHHTSLVPKVGQIVLVDKANTHRHKWPLGCVLSLERGTDGKVRAASLRCNNTVIRRPVNLLVPLEVEAQTIKDDEPPSEPSQPEVVEAPPRVSLARLDIPVRVRHQPTVPATEQPAPAVQTPSPSPPPAQSGPGRTREYLHRAAKNKH